MKKSVPVISANFLQRIAQPASRFHPDYLAYRDREITWAELVARLPHVAMIGDSVCTNVYISSLLSTFWRARTCRGNNWFLDTNPSPASIRSVSKRLEDFTPFVAMEYAGIGALVDHGEERQNFFPSELEQPESRLQRQSRHLRENFARQMRRLISCARMQPHRVAIVVYGLVNFEAYFKGREIAERLRAEDAARYPHLETTYKYFTSFRPIYRPNLIRLALMVNEELRAMVSELNHEFGGDVKLQVRYSDALATADLSRVELLHAIPSESRS
ncbi:MAG: hypothetical protein DME96_00930 [Verrucomicrobia bacterium]|nr:MAG: hypothetical protein DME96_00930 [Verrucomicrobiota bacterium]